MGVILQMENVVIIGAGPAGLTAAYELLKKDGYNVTVLEASDRIGGISQTVRYNGNRMDIGGHRFFSKDERVMNWWYDILPPQGAPSKDELILGTSKEYDKNGVDPEKTNDVMLKRNRVSRIYYNGKFFDYPVSLKWETIKNMGFVTTMKAGFSYLGAVMRKQPEDSLENFYKNRFGKVLYSMFFEGYTEKLWGRHPKYISADWGSQRVKGLSIRAVIADMFGKIFGGNRKVETSLIEEYIYPKLGPGQLYEKVRDKIVEMGGEVKMNCPVVKINEVRGKIEIGNNDNNQILNMNSYKAKIEVTVVSNKNTNKYKMTQEYKKGEYCMQEVEEPENIRGVRIEYSNNTLSLKNTNMDLTNIYENYKYMAENNLFLNEFIDDFNNSSNSKHEENENEIILSTDCKTQENKYQVKKKLTIDKKTNKPKKLEVQDINQNITVYILYNEISYK